MKVTLISYTPDAADLLLFTKSTRLTMSPGLMSEIKKLSDEEKLVQLEYMSKTIPSSWEFCDFTFLVEDVTRACTHQMVRTRAASYAQQTMRLLPMTDFETVMPETVSNAGDFTRPGGDIWHDLMDHIQSTYNDLLAMGVPAEDARGILPTNICTNIVAKYNLRTMSELCRSRTGGRTQGEYQSVVNAMADEILKVYPWAHMFLFPGGRDKFAAVEAALKELKKTNPELAMAGMKDIDLLRKEQ